MPNGAIALSEDLFFCYRAAQLGYTLLVDFDLKCGHAKGEIDIAAIWSLADRAREQGRTERSLDATRHDS
jgi:GT2 family glycosyltransferase